MSNRKVLVMSVGGSPEPLIHSIDNIKPKLVYFIHSEKTLSVVDEINKNTKHKYDYLTKQVDNHESIEDAFEKSKEILFELNKKGWDEITIDFTGGTKPMTAGLVLASTGDKYTDSYNYSYVGSKMSENAEVRNKDGVGIVISGHEQIKPQKDPYDTYAVLEFNRGKNFFNHYQFEAAIQNFKEAEAKLDDGELKDLAKFYIKLVNFYQKWDKFNDRIEIYNEKLDKIESFKLPSYFYKEIIQKCPNELLNNDFDNSEEFINQLNNNLEFLRLKIQNNQKEAMKYYLPDLLNNAHRKIEEGFFDDAVARLYRAIELIAQVSLNIHDLIDVEKFKNHKVFHINRKQFKTQTKFDPEIPKMIQNWNIKEYEDRDKTFKVPKDKSYKILEAFGEDLKENPDDEATIVGKSVLLYKLGKLNESLNCLNQIENIRNVSIIELKAVILMGLENYKQALELLNEVLKVDNGNISALYYKTECLFQLKRFNEVVDTANVALKIDKNHQSILINKFCSLVELNSTKEALKVKEKLLRLGLNCNI